MQLFRGHLLRYLRSRICRWSHGEAHIASARCLSGAASFGIISFLFVFLSCPLLFSADLSAEAFTDGARLGCTVIP